MAKMVVERKGGQQAQGRETCYVVTKQAWSGLTRDACSHCDVSVPADATECPRCGRLVLNR